jgi:hypothetical protein
MANIYNENTNNHIIIEMNLDTYNYNTTNNIVITEEIREEILDRLIAITRMIFRYNCNPNQTYKNIVKDLINNEIEIDKVYKLFNLMLNDIPTNPFTIAYRHTASSTFASGTVEVLIAFEIIEYEPSHSD